MAIYKSKRVYYKYQDWVQPVLTANSSNSDFILTSNSLNAYMLFDNDASTGIGWTSGSAGSFSGKSYYVEMKFANKVNVSNIAVTNRSVGDGSTQTITSGSVQVSDDGVTWNKVTDWTNSNTTQGATWNIAVSHEGYYKYVRFYVNSGTTSNSGNNINTMALKLTAQEIVESTKEDHDYSVVEPDKIKDVYKSTERAYYKYGKELNATVVGSFARIDNGVASGFSTSQYLKLPEVFNPQNNPWEALFKVRINTLINGSQVILGQRNGGGYNFYVDINKVRLEVGGTAFTGTTTLQENTTYWFKYTFTGDTYIVKSSTNGVDWVDEINTASTITATPTSDDCRIGVWYNTYDSGLGNQFLGSIDLSQSYINITGERWWSGDEYTTVGSWIDDGVVSGFSTGNYLTLPAAFNPSSNNWDMYIKLTTSDVSTRQYILGREYFFDLYIMDSKLTIDLGNGSSWSSYVIQQGTTVLTSNTVYYVKYSYNNGNYVIYLSTDGVDYNEEIRVGYQHQSSHIIPLGRIIATVTNLLAFSGSIDLTKTYIKINDKMWWHGTKAVETTPDDAVYSDVFKKRIVAAYKTGNRKYYKYVLQDWTQPVLSSNGTVGGSSFAVRASNTDSRTQPYYAFDSNKANSYAAGWLSKASNNYLEWYNPEGLNISQLKIQYQTEPYDYVGYVSSWEIKVSNDGANYTSLLKGTKGNYGITTIPIEHSGAYKYWRFYVYAWSSEWYDILDLQITAKKQIVVESTSSDHDYSVVPNQLVYNLKYNLNSSSAYAKEGTVSGTNRFGTDTGETTSENLNQTSIFTFNTPAPAGKWTGSFRYYSQVNFSMNQVYWRLTYEDGTQEYAYGPTSLGDTAYGGGERATISISFTAKKPIKTVTVYAQGSGGGSGRYGGLEYIQMFFDGSKQ